jgi:hypothetical protein
MLIITGSLMVTVRWWPGTQFCISCIKDTDIASLVGRRLHGEVKGEA